MTLFEGSKSDLAGFYDPTPSPIDGEEDEEDGDNDGGGGDNGSPRSESKKELLVFYLYQGAMHRVIVEDREALRIPKTTHRL